MDLSTNEAFFKGYDRLAKEIPASLKLWCEFEEIERLHVRERLEYVLSRRAMLLPSAPLLNESEFLRVKASDEILLANSKSIRDLIGIKIEEHFSVAGEGFREDDLNPRYELFAAQKCRCGQLVASGDIDAHSKCNEIEDLKEKVSALTLKANEASGFLDSLKDLLNEIEGKEGDCVLCGSKFSHLDSCLIVKLRKKHGGEILYGH